MATSSGRIRNSYSTPIYDYKLFALSSPYPYGFWFIIVYQLLEAQNMISTKVCRTTITKQFIQYPQFAYISIEFK